MSEPTIRLEGVEYLERVRCEVRLEPRFDEVAFAAAFDRFRQLFNVAPLQAACSADVLFRLDELAADRGERSEILVRHIGVPLYAAILPPGCLVLEGEVDEDRMGDW
ncbi:MAG: hypothetical protein ACP5O6_04220 [Candidatus Baltobacteraceae bacterium]